MKYLETEDLENGVWYLCQTYDGACEEFYCEFKKDRCHFSDFFGTPTDFTIIRYVLIRTDKIPELINNLSVEEYRKYVK